MNTKLICHLSIAASLIGTASAATLAVNFSGRATSAGATPDELLTQSGASAGTAAGANGTATFQDIIANYNTSPGVGPLVINGTDGSSANINFVSNGTWSNTASSSRGVVAENATGDLLDGHIEGSSPTGVSVTIDSLNFTGTYDLYVYIGDDAGGRSGSVTVDGVTRTFTSRIYDGTLVNASAGGGAVGDYMLFSGLSGSTQTITMGGIDSSNRTGLNGFEIIGTAVPEPGSTALLGLGGLALILCRRK
ncbi:MAG: PEP-CTERM sorting domain-containing protein [Akkermansiaceae bacterium]